MQRADAHPRREQAARRPHRRADRRPGPLRHRASSTPRPSSCCPGAPGCGTTTCQFVGGIQRIYAGDISPDDSYFVVTSGSGGDRPPINDTAVAFPIDRRRQQRPAAVDHRAASTASTPSPSPRRPSTSAATSSWNESPDRARPVARPRQRRLRHRPGPVRLRPGRRRRPPRPPRRARPGHGKALRVEPGSNSFEGNKAMLVTPRGLFTGGDATHPGRRAASAASRSSTSTRCRRQRRDDTTITDPDRGPRRAGRRSRSRSTGTATVASGGVTRVQVEIQDRDTKRTSQDDLTTWSTTPTRSTPPSAHAGRDVDHLVAAADDRRQPDRSRLMAKTFATSAGQRPGQGGQEDRDVRPRRPDADDQHHRPRQPVLNRRRRSP